LGLLPDVGLLAAVCGIHILLAIPHHFSIDGCIALLSLTDLSIVHKLVTDGTVYSITVRSGMSSPALAALSTPRSSKPRLHVYTLEDRTLMRTKVRTLLFSVNATDGHIHCCVVFSLSICLSIILTENTIAYSTYICVQYRKV